MSQVGGPAELDGEDDAGEHSGGAHDVLRNMAGDGWCDRTADRATEAHHDGERPIDGTTDDEHDCGGNVRTEPDYRLQRVDLVERADLTQVENRQGKRTCCGTEISGINADKTYAKPDRKSVV